MAKSFGYGTTCETSCGTSARSDDMTTRRITLGSDLAFSKYGMAFSRHSHKTVSEKANCGRARAAIQPDGSNGSGPIFGARCSAHCPLPRVVPEKLMFTDQASKATFAGNTPLRSRVTASSRYGRLFRREATHHRNVVDCRIGSLRQAYFLAVEAPLMHRHRCNLALNMTRPDPYVCRGNLATVPFSVNLGRMLLESVTTCNDAVGSPALFLAEPP